MRWMITGAAGMVGKELVAAATALGEPFAAFGRDDLDIRDREAVLSAARACRPEVIINSAAFTKVDECEVRQDEAAEINGAAVAHLAAAANETGARLIQISTDFVFDGSAQHPYEPEDPVDPISVYGSSKLMGEREASRAHRSLIVRTSWVFGKGGPNFVEAVRGQVAAGRTKLRVVNDQRGRPTYARHLAMALIDLAREAPEDARIVHYADAPDCTWYDFAVEIIRRIAPSVRVDPVSTDQFPRPARRPAWSVLSTRRYEEITGRKPMSWAEGLDEYLAMTRE